MDSAPPQAIPPVAPAPTKTSPVLVVFLAFQSLVITAVLALVVYLLHAHPTNPTPTASTDFVKVGKALAPALGSTSSAGFVATADALDAGKSVDDAQAAGRTAYEAARQQVFAASVGPDLAKVLPEGSTPTADQRTAFSKAFRDMSKGVGGK